METPGSLVDKLMTVSQKLWHQEEKAQATGADDHTVAEAKRRISALNLQRNALIEEYDTLMRDIIEGRKSYPVIPQFKDYVKSGG